MAEWFLFRDLVLEQDLINIQYIDSVNPFGDYIIAQIEDNLGQKFDEFPFGTGVQVLVEDEDGNQFQKFRGFVVERRERDEQGQDVLEVEAYSFDQFLRQNDVSNDQSGKLISEAIKDIVQIDTPVDFVQANVNVVDDFELQRSFQDERVGTALQSLSFLSGNEGFGVNFSKDFFFRPREQREISRGIDNTQWFNYDIPERGKESANEVEVRYDDGDKSVIVDNSDQKLKLKRGLGLSEPATKRERITRANIRNAQDAENEGRRFLKLKNVTLTGTITTFGLFEAEPLDIIDVEIIPRGIDSTFVITQIEYNWGRDETTLTVVEQRGFDDDLFVRLSEKTERIDLRDTEPQAVQNRVIATDVSASVTSQLTSPAENKFSESTTTNTCVDKITSGWAGNDNISVDKIVVGDGSSEPSRTDTELDNQTNSVFTNSSKTFIINNPISVIFEQQITQNNVQEIGLKDDAGDLLARGVFDSPFDQSGDLKVSFFIDDASGVNSVVTEDGQKAIRDIIADDNPAVPNEFAVGDNRVSPSETLTSLSSRVNGTNLNRTVLQRLDTADEFAAALDIDDEKPVSIDDLRGGVQLDPVTYYAEAERVENFNGSIFQSTARLSNDKGVNISVFQNFVEFVFTLNNDVPANELRVGTYAELNDWEGTIEYSFDGNVYRTVSRGNVSGVNLPEGGFLGVNPTKLEAGTTHVLRAENIGAQNGSHVVDAMFAYDNRVKFDIQAPAQSAFNGDTYEFPEKFPKQASVTFNEVNSRRNLTELELFQDWNNTDNNAAVTLTIGNNSQTINNPSLNTNGRIRETFSVSQADQSRTGQIEITLSRFNDTSSSSIIPADGDGGQRVTFHNVDGNPDAVTRSGIGKARTRGFFKSGLLRFNTLREGGQLSLGANLLTYSTFADIQPRENNIIPSETITFIPDGTRFL